ncbi:UPF0182 family membrane protein [Actinomyces urogenitalis]|uniref:UPF0182 family membrane protein n=1 Tax=Actinomyces urogenitalis TaxID=103621 RepID=UPI00254AAB93|nr:UPF0182 family protein [Actinomyces urogenitalis]MDK8237412.1 UPF0182 family protein [Actinomyces urogenitalis]WOO94210.1 UPF0182 family protein [Actinomyces urogenitalis]
MSTRPDDEPTDKPGDQEDPASSREDRVRGGFFQPDATRTPHHGQEDGASEPAARRSSPPDDDDELPQDAGFPFGFDPTVLFGGARSGAAGRGAAGRADRPGEASGDGGDGAGGSGTPRSRGREGRRGPGPLALTIMILAGLAVVLLFLSRTWTEVLWFSQLGFSRVVWTQWIAAGAMFIVGTLIMFLAVLAAMTRAYRAREITLPYDEASRNLESYRTAFEPMRKPLTFIVPALLGVFAAGLELVPHWREVMLALNSQSFGTTDPQFGLDVSFYVFILPVLTTVVSYLSRVVIFAGLASVVVHYLYGGISVARQPHFTKAARIHLSVFLTLFALLRAADYWLSRYQALYSSNTKFDGASYTDVNAVIPANAILAAIAAVIAVLFIASVRARSWKLPVTGVVVMIASALLIGTGYPLVIQRFVVDPNAQREEAPYIQRNINATLTAYGLDGIETTNYNAATTAQAGQLKEDAESTTSIRLLDPNLVSATFKQLQQNKQYYSFASSLNVDRYNVEGQSRDTVIAVRELNLDGLDAGQRTWINEHTVYTHGYGMVTAYGNTVASGGYPSFWEGGIPSSGDLGEYEPRIYFGQQSPSYSIVGGDDGGSPRELDYPDDKSDSGQVNTTFAGNGGPDVSNPWNRLLYAVRFQEMNILFSQEVRDGSQILYNRNPAQRVSKVAPWLTLDGNPYPAVVDDDDDPSTPKRVVWILDGYTTTNNYPYAQHESLEDSMSDATTGQASLLGAPEKSNYVRNSVKAVVDAYDGAVTLYEWDEQDPILAAWSKVFPGSVTPMSQMSADLMAHMRYPEDLFKVQRTVMAKYHVTNPEDFYSGGDFWKVPDDPTKSGAGAQAPYYLTLKMPDQDKASFSLSSVYIIGGNTDRNVLTGFMAVDSETASGEPGVRNPDYGKLRLLELPRSSNVSGPGQVQNNFDSDSTASQVLNLLSQQGSQVIKGNLLTLPVGGGLLYVQPVYVQSSSGTQYPLLRKVLVSFGDKVGFADTLSEALDQVFGGDSGAQTGEDVVDGDAAAANNTSDEQAAAGAADGDGAAASAAPSEAAGAEPTQADTPAPGEGAATGDAQTRLDTALVDARSAMTAANEAMKNGDWTAYGEAQTRLNDALNRAVAAQEELKK